MSYSYYNDKILAYWSGKPLIAREAFAQIADFLRCLQAFSNVFSQLYVVQGNRRRRTALEPDFSNFNAELAARMDTRRGYWNADPDNVAFSMTSHAIQGFGTMFSTVPTSSKTGCWVSVTCGRYEGFLPSNLPNMVDVTVSPELATPAFLRGLLEQTVLFWRPEDAFLNCNDVDDLLEQPVGEPGIGWLTYLSDPAAGGAVPNDIAQEPLADGILIQAADQPGKADDADYVARLIRLRDALRLQGFLINRSDKDDKVA